MTFLDLLRVGKLGKFKGTVYLRQSSDISVSSFTGEFRYDRDWTYIYHIEGGTGYMIPLDNIAFIKQDNE